MSAREDTLNQQWVHRLSVVRLLLGVLCLGVQLLPAFLPRSGFVLIALIFLAYSLLTLGFRRGERRGAVLLTLFLDTVFFLSFVAYGPAQHFWLSAVFYIYLLFSAAVVHQWWDVCMVVGVCVAFLLLSQAPQVELLWSMVLAGGLLACLLAFVKGGLERSLAEAEKQVEDLRACLGETRDAERQRIAADFHDGPLQSFISLQMRLEVLKRVMERDPSSALEELRLVQELSTSQVRDLRSFLSNMRPVEVDSSDLVVSARRVVDGFQKDSGISSTFLHGDGAISATAETSLEVLQVMREALHNIQKHSKATRVVVTMKKTDGCLEMAINDNGQGHSFSGNYTLEELEALGMGPASIKRRVRRLGGELQLESRPGQGAVMKFRIPS